MTEKRTILITGATGKQGRGVLDAIAVIPSQNSSTPLHMVAMVRDPSSAGAQALTKLPYVSVVQEDLNDPKTAFKNYGKPVWGVYSVQVNSESELAQGKGLVDAAIAHGVQNFVYSSGDRGGTERSDRSHQGQKLRYQIRHRATPQVSMSVTRRW